MKVQKNEEELIEWDAPASFSAGDIHMLGTTVYK
jgi:hypothetical protein